MRAPAATAGLSAAAAATTRALRAAAGRCDTTALVTRAAQDTTALGLASEQPTPAWALPRRAQRYRALATLLTLPAAREGSQWVTPRVATAPDDLTAWDEVVRAGLLTRAQADAMRGAGRGYTGWRAGVTDDGRWAYFVTVSE